MQRTWWPEAGTIIVTGPYWTPRNKLEWNFNRNSDIFIQESAFECIVCEMAAILSRPQCVNACDDCRDLVGYLSNLDSFTVSLHSTKHRHLPAVGAEQGDCRLSLQSGEHFHRSYEHTMHCDTRQSQHAFKPTYHKRMMIANWRPCLISHCCPNVIWLGLRSSLIWYLSTVLKENDADALVRCVPRPLYCFTWGHISTACAISLSGNDGKCRYISMIPYIIKAHNGLRT